MPLSLDEFEKLTGRTFRPDDNAPQREYGWADRAGAAVDRAQAGLLGVGEAFGLDSLADARRANQYEADMTRALAARDTGAPQSFKEVDSVGSLGRYVGGLAVDSWPELATALGTGGVGMALKLGNTARMGVLGAVSAPSALGDILQNQREEAGQTDLTSALPLTVPYVAADMLGLEGALARGRMLRTGVRALDDMTGWKGALARTGANAGINYVAEGTSETLQEGVNQLGRMAVNPDQTLFNSEANDRYLESFVGGGLLGSAVSAPMGGWMRSPDYRPTAEPAQPGGKTVDLLDREWTTSRGFEGVEQGAPLRQPLPNRAVDPALGDLTPEWTTSAGASDGAPPAGVDALDLWADRAPTNTPRMEALAAELGLPTNPAVPNTLQMPGVPYVPEVSASDSLGNTAGSELDNALINDPGAALARQQWMAQREEAARTEALRQQAATRLAEMQALRAEAAGFNIKGDKAVGLFGELKAMHKDGKLTDASYTENLALLADRKMGAVQRYIAAVTDPTNPMFNGANDAPPQVTPLQPRQPAQSAAPATTTQGAVDVRNDAAAGRGPAGVPGAERPAPTGGAGVAVDAGQPAGGGAVAGAAAPGTPGGQDLPVRPGGDGAAAVKSPGQRLVETLEAKAGKKMPEVVRRRMYLLAGMDPDEGFLVGSPRTLDQVAAIEAAVSGTSKAVSREAVRKSLVPFGITGDVIKRLGAMAQDAAEAPAATDENADGELVERVAPEDNSPVLSDELAQVRADVGEGESTGLRVDVGPNSGGVLAAATPQQRALEAEGTKLLGGERAMTAQSRKDAAVAEATTPQITPEQAARNAEIIAANRAQIETLEADRQARSSLRSTLPEPLWSRVDDAKDEWAGDLVEGDVAWDDLPTPLQAQWVKAFNAWDTAQIGDRQYNRTYEDIKDEARRLRGEPAGSGGQAVAGGAAAGGLQGAGGRAGTAADAGPQGAAARDQAANPGAGAGKPAAPGTDPDLKFSADQGWTGSTVDQVLAEFSRLGLRINTRKVVVVQSVQDLPAKYREGVTKKSKDGKLRPTAFVAGGKAYFIADNIRPGASRAKFMHEVGAHLGIEGLLSEDQLDNLVQKILDWADADNGTLESQLARAAIARTGMAGTPDNQLSSEIIAYFVEEAVAAGVDPTAMSYKGDLARWFRALYAAFKAAIRKLSWANADRLTAQDVIDLAYGAAKLEMDGVWHGTAAQFRKFDHKFMGSGEGAQVYGWGTYLAQRPGIAKGYFEADVGRKTGEVTVVYEGREYTAAELYEATSRVREAAGLPSYVQTADSLPYAALYALASVGLSGMEYSAKRNSYIRDQVEWLRANRDAYELKENAPEGALMRVDVLADESEMLDWDKPLSEQSELVKAAFKRLPRNVVDLGDDGELFLNPYDVGSDVYARLEKELGSDKAASEYLDSIGVKGIKFLDARSRGVSTVNFREFPKYDALRAAAKEDDFFGFDTRSEMLGAIVSHPDFADRWDAGQNAALYNEFRAWYLEQVNAPKTRNLVIFNDKNIFRVATLRGADPDKVRFSADPVSATLSTPVTESQASKNIAQLPSALRPAARVVWKVLQQYGSKALDVAGFTSSVLKRAVEAGIKSAGTYERLMAERRVKATTLEQEVERIADLYNALPERDKGTGDGSVNAFLYDSTRTGKWGFEQDWRAKDAQVPVTDAMRAQFNALTPQGQAFVREVFKHGDAVLVQKQDLVLKHTASVYDPLIAAETDPAKKAELQAQKANELTKFKTLFATQIDLPYAPMRRFGPYAVVGKSEAYKAAEADGNSKELAKLEKDPRHYYVTFAENRLQAETLRQEVAKTFGEEGTQAFERSQFNGNIYGDQGMLASLAKLRAMVESRAGDEESKARAKALAQMQQLVSEMYLQALADSSARKSEMHRRSISGDLDMLRSFTTQGRADANFLAAVEFNAPVQDAMQTMRAEARRAPDRMRASGLMNEIEARYQQSLEVDESPVVDRVRNVTSVWFLATSPAYYLQNLLQPYMMSVPLMAGRHGWAQAAKAQLDAYTDLKDMVRTGGLTTQFDFTAVPPKYRAAIDALTARGLIDIGLETELGEFRVEGKGPMRDGLGRVGKILRSSTQKVEALNRVSTAMAAYQLELERSGDDQKAIDYAAGVLRDTHGDYTRFNAPRIFNTNFGKIALQFRKFQLIQLSLLARLVRDASRPGPERAAAVKALAYTLTHTAVMAGAMGLPGYAAISWVLGKVLGDDEEPFDLTQYLRQSIGDEGVANLIMRGAPTLGGVDLSTKVGMGNALSILPFNDVDLLNRRSVTEALGTLVGGASLGLAMRGLDGIALMRQGDYYKGLEGLLPKGLSDAMKAARISQDGVTGRNGDVQLSADEVSAWESIWQGVGVAPVEQSVQAERRAYVRDTTTAFNDRAKSITSAYVKAVRSGDGEAAAEARQAWTRLQAARVENGLTRQPMSTLLRAPAQAAKRVQQTAGGVQYNKSNKEMVESLQ